MIKKGIIKQLLQNYNLKKVEQHLFYSYLITQKINIQESVVLQNYLGQFKPEKIMLTQIFSLEISDIKELENYLELIIPVADRKLNGAFFTPEYIIEFIIDEIRPNENDKNLDPSCGCGAFLVGLIEYYREKFKKPIRNILRENIFGSDILEYNIRRTKIILTLLAIQHGEYPEETDFNLFCQDSLRTTWKLSFDNIVGNPPYVKFQDLSVQNREYLAKRWSTARGGTYNIYFAFFELGYKLLKPSGKLGYITPNNYFTSLAGEALRKFFQQKKCVYRIADFNHQKVFDAQTYTAITFINKRENEAILYDRISNEQKPVSFLDNANGSPNFIETLNPKKWRLLKSDEQYNIRKIETIGIPIGKMFDISVGIATLKDEVFFVDGNHFKNGYFIKTTEKGTFQIEEEIVKSVYKISDFKTQNEIENNRRKIICPYKFNNGSAHPISEPEFMNRFPGCYAYLVSEKTKLMARDKGKVHYQPFYVWGRTQGLTKRGKKILNPTFSQHPRFLLVEEEDAYFTNGYGLYFKRLPDQELFANLVNPLRKEENIKVVQKILNSVVMDYYIRKTSVSIEGGYPCYQKNFIENFSIPEFSDKEIESLKNLTTKESIDEFLLEKYQLKIPVPNLLS
ncbi:MAG: HsdM family class I SAM-dependent methyltransferase [Bacteroidales bacterium]